MKKDDYNYKMKILEEIISFIKPNDVIIKKFHSHRDSYYGQMVLEVEFDDQDA